MYEDGVPLAMVLAALRFHGIDAYPQDGLPSMMVLTDGKETTLAFPLGERVSRGMVHRIARCFDVPIHHIFNPHLAEPKP